MSKTALFGCTAEPLGSYLKALGVWRLVAEQGDAEALGWWERGGWFRLDSKLDAKGLADFFLRKYRPTPILAPWNAGSGFYAKDRKVGIEAIAQSSDARFEVYRRAIEIARAVPEVIAGKRDAKAEEEQRRTTIQLACRNTLPDEAVDWLDATVGISSEGTRFFPPILGTGGNDGRLDYTNNFMEHVANLLLREGSDSQMLLGNALFGDPAAGLEPSAVGQYDPGRAGGFNQGQEVETKDVPMNPWNFVLTLEGAVAWAAGVYRRQGMRYRSFLCSPFTVRATPVGYGSAASDDGAVSRAEVWAPLWDRPAGYREVRTLLREGRASIDGKPARNGLEFAQAASMLGIDRGISGFVRYSLLMRRGKSYIALPAGRFTVSAEPQEADLIRELSALLGEADWRLKDAPPWYGGARRQIDESMYECLLRAGVDGLRDAAAATGRWMRLILTSGRSWFPANPLSARWVAALGDTVEGRIAAALSGMWQLRVGSFRDHLDRTSHRFSWAGRDLPERMTATLERRVLTAEAEGVRRNPFGSRRLARVADAIRFLEGSVDDELIEDLLFALTLVDWKQVPFSGARSGGQVGIWPVYALLKHLFLTSPISSGDEERFIAADLNVVAALRAGDIQRATRIATSRLENAGLAPPNAVFDGGFDSMRLAAALLIPTPYGAALRKYCERGEAE